MNTKSEHLSANQHLTATYGNSENDSVSVESSGQELMHPEEPAKAVIVVSAKQPEAHMQEEMGAHGINMRWGQTIKGATGLLKAPLDGTILITELMLQDGTWKELLRRVRRIDRYIPVLLVSSTSTAELWWDALECGVEDIILALCPPSGYANTWESRP
ncbi:MAG: hypothetical protein JO108_01325 [Acidobacteriaceae bacterium]|nr:hypothetical protein [Acidobacteriaceae bacterium]